MVTLMRVRPQLSDSMIASVRITWMTFVTMLISVPVTARCAPTTSLFSRAMISPVFVLVKKRSDMLCMC